MRPLASYDASVMDGTLSDNFLQGIDVLETNLRMDQWEHRSVALGTFLILFMVRQICGEKYGVNWWGLLHSVVTGYLAFVVIFLNAFAAEPLTGTDEPLRSVMCGGPLTSLHRILPAITYGYGALDILEGLKLSTDFVSGIVVLGSGQKVTI